MNPTSNIICQILHPFLQIGAATLSSVKSLFLLSLIYSINIHLYLHYYHIITKTCLIPDILRPPILIVSFKIASTTHRFAFIFFLHKLWIQFWKFFWYLPCHSGINLNWSWCLCTSRFCYLIAYLGFSYKFLSKMFLCNFYSLKLSLRSKL